MKKTFLLIFLLIAVSCSSIEQKPQKTLSVSPQYKREYKSALENMESGRYQLAVEGFTALAEKQKNGPSKWSALFNVGSAYLKMRKCRQSKKVLSDLVKQVDDDYNFKGRIFLQLHYAYECLSESRKALVELKNADKKKSTLSEEVSRVEIPARFSILYAQLKANSQALFFQNLALKGLHTIKSAIKDEATLKRTASKLFYIMGHSQVHEEHIKINEYLLALPYHQIYLTQSFLLSDPVWSAESKKELKKLYNKLWPAYKKLSDNQKKIYRGKIIQSINNFQKIARDSRSQELEDLLSSIVSKALTKMKK